MEYAGYAGYVFDRLSRGRQLRVTRVAADLTIFELSQRTGLTPPRISELERDIRVGRPDEWTKINTVLDQALRIDRGVPA